MITITPAGIAADKRPNLRTLKAQLIQLRKDLHETDESPPHIQNVIDAHWND